MLNTAPTENRALESFENQVREHQSGLRAFIRALGADDPWVDDLAQETFLVAFRRFHEFEPGTDFGRWLRRIARYLVANERRKQARHSRLLPSVVADVLARHEPEDMPNDGLRGLLQALRECIEQLPPRGRELLQRRYAGNTTAATLASQLSVNADALRQQLLRLRLAVKHCIEQKGAGIDT